jgi:hypothetical protein
MKLPGRSPCPLVDISIGADEIDFTTGGCRRMSAFGKHLPTDTETVVRASTRHPMMFAMLDRTHEEHMSSSSNVTIDVMQVSRTRQIS